jgi:hypothetical protein
MTVLNNIPAAWVLLFLIENHWGEFAAAPFDKTVLHKLCTAHLGFQPGPRAFRKCLQGCMDAQPDLIGKEQCGKMVKWTIKRAEAFKKYLRGVCRHGNSGLTIRRSTQTANLECFINLLDASTSAPERATADKDTAAAAAIQPDGLELEQQKEPLGQTIARFYHAWTTTDIQRFYVKMFIETSNTGFLLDTRHPEFASITDTVEEIAGAVTHVAASLRL